MFIKIKVVAGSKKEVIKKITDTRYVVSVREKAERNLANERLCQIMAQLFGVNRKLIRIISGHQSPNKILSINND